MCGIVGYIGPRQASTYLLEGLRRLEYRGYDSAGIATFAPRQGTQAVRSVGRIDGLAQQLTRQPVVGTVGIGHTRWATHGEPSEINAHPHTGGDGAVTLVHNGVIENYQRLKADLIAAGYVFHSATDTEVVAHLLDSCLKDVQRELRGDRAAPEPVADPGSHASRLNGAPISPPPSLPTVQASDPESVLLEAVSRCLRQLRGTYGLAILFRDFPDYLVVARNGSPLVIGVGRDEHFVASDASPLVGNTDKIVYLADRQIALVGRQAVRVVHLDEGNVDHTIEALAIESQDVDLGSYPHYMLKEIFEQPESLTNTMRGRLDRHAATAQFGGLNLTPQTLRSINKIILTACGTSWHAALVGEYLIEKWARIPVEVEYASELRYRNPPVDSGTLIFAITQSGETADTLAAMREMKRKGHPTLAICNVVGSTIAQEADGGVYLHAGPEIGVASTKAYTSQVLVLTLLALYFGRLRHLGYDEGRAVVEALEQLPDLARRTLEMANDAARRIAGQYLHARNVLYLGRQMNFPTALEGALKLKEISYIHAEGYPAAEMKHGPIALVDRDTPSVFIMPKSTVYEKVVSNLEEIKARGGPVIAVAEEDDDQIHSLADDVLIIPSAPEILQPILTVIPLQLLAYHISVLKGCDVDKPRNLAKSVTVE